MQLFVNQRVDEREHDRLLRHLRMEQDNPSAFDLLVGDCERAVAEGHFKPAHGRIVPDIAFQSA
jgi:hypothetical protein